MDASDVTKGYTRSYRIPFYIVTALLIAMVLGVGLLHNYQFFSSIHQTAPTVKIVVRDTTNYVLNSSVETASHSEPDLPAYWTANSWGENQATFTYLNTGHNSSRSLKVQVTSYNNGDAKWSFAPLMLKPEQEYQFTDYYQSDTTTRVVALYTYANGQTKADELRHAPASPSSWTQYKDSFVVPQNTKSVSVLHLISSVGYLTTDDFAVMPYTPAGFNRPMVTLTFDNGFEVNINTVLPKLNVYGFKSTQYISPAYLITDQQENPHLPAYVKTFYNSGQEIASHTWDHANLTTLTPSQVNDELVSSKRYLDNIVGSGKVQNFALPFGAYNSQILNAVKTDFGSDRTVDPGYNSKDNFDRYRLKVQNMLPTTTLAEFQGWLARARQNNTWLILVYHRVASDPGQYDTATRDFGPQIDAVKRSGIAVVTIKDGLREVMPQLGH